MQKKKGPVEKFGFPKIILTIAPHLQLRPAFSPDAHFNKHGSEWRHEALDMGLRR
jgi:hypothetical protein